MNLYGQIELINVPQEFVRLCNTALYTEHGDDFLSIDDDRPDRGNDGYLKSERRMFAMHCFRRLQNQQLDREIYVKMKSDLAKAIELKRSGTWNIEAWTFLCNYPVPEGIANRIVRIGSEADIDVSWRGPQYLADVLQRHPEIREHFPNLQVYEVTEQLRSLADKIAPTPDDISRQRVQIGVPYTATEQELLLQQRPIGWEYLLFAGALLQSREKLRPKLHDHELRYARRLDQHLEARDAAHYLSGTLNQASRIAEHLMQVFDPAVQERAFGPPGQPGDSDRIIHMATRVVGSIEEFIDWAANLRGISIPDEMARAFELAAQIADKPMQDILEFIDGYIQDAEAIPALLSRNKHVSLSRTLTLTVDHAAVSRFNAELRRLQR